MAKTEMFGGQVFFELGNTIRITQSVLLIYFCSKTFSLAPIRNAVCCTVISLKHWLFECEVKI